MNTFSASFDRVVRMLMALLLAFSGGGILPASAQLNQEDFKLSGSARFLDANCIQLTPQLNNQVGAIWFQKKINLEFDFEVIAQINLGSLDGGGADGIVFALQPLSNTVGVSGGGMGIMDVTPSLAVEFDTWQNDDPPFDHIALIKDGNVNHYTSPGTTLKGPFPLLPNGANAEDGQYRPVKFIWTAATKRFQAFYNNVLLIDHTEDIVNTIFNGDPNVYWGFTAATGGAINDQRVCLESYQVIREDQCFGATILQNDTAVCTGSQLLLKADGTEFEPGNINSFSASLRQNIVAFWPFNGNAQDQTGNGHDGTVSGAVLTTGRSDDPNTAYQFAGNDYISVPDHPDLQLINTDFSISVWVDMSAAENFMLYKGDGTGVNTPKFIFNYQNGKMGFHVNGPGLGSGVWTYSQMFTATGWTLLTVMRTGGTIIFYVNDKQVGQYAFFSTMPSTAGFPLRIGGTAPGAGSGWIGKLDDISIFHRILSSNELGELMTNRRTFRWSTGETGTSITVKPIVTTTYVLTVQEGNSVCQDSVKVTVTPSFSVLAQPATAQVCKGDSVKLSASSAESGLSYTWESSPGLSPTAGNEIWVKPANTTSYILTGTDATGCQASDTVDVLVNPLPMVDIPIPSVDICAGSAAALQVEGSGTNLIYNWSPSAGLSGTTSSSISASPVDSTRYFVRGTDALGCSAVDSVDVNVLPLPQVNIPENELNVCIGSSATIRVENPSVNLSYNWSPTDGISSATDRPEIGITPSVSARYLVTATDGNGCQGVDSINVMVTALPTVDIQPSSVTLCNDDPVTLTAVSPTQNLSYSWSPSVGLSSVSTASVSARPPSTTQYTVTVTDEFGCVGTDDAEVVVATRPFVQIQPSSTRICLGESVDLGTLAAGPGLTYEWSPATTLNATSGPSVVATPTATTRYKVSVTTSEGCTTADSVIILVSAVASPIFQPAAPLVCVGSSITIRVANLGSDVRYIWSPTTGLSAAEGSTIVANPSVTTTYTVTASDAAGCQATGTITVSIAPLPIIDATPSSASICLGSSVSLRATSPSAGVIFDWTPTIGLSTPTGAIVSAKPVRSTTYRLTGTDNNGCSSSMDIPITVLPVPSVNAGPDYLIPVGDRIQLDPIVSADVTDYLWSPALGLSCLTCSKPELRPRSSGTYILEVRNSAGCTASDSLRVELICSDKNLFIPNTFSPNGDGVNDVFYPRGVGMSKVEFLRIFDRWGNMVFEKLNFNIEDKSAGWNGTIKGSFAPPGVYVYTTRLVCDNNEILNVKGSITLIH